MTDRLEHAVRAVREAYDGTSEDAQRTLARVLREGRAVPKGRRRIRAGLLLAAALAISTAAAAHTSQLPRAFLDWLRGKATSTFAAPSGPSSQDVHEPPAGAGSAALGSPVVAADVAESRTSEADLPASSRPAASGRASSGKPPPAASAPTAEPLGDDAMYAHAHRLHFHGGDPAAALAALEGYLRAFPNGRFGPEARYNRAIDLLKLQRLAEARAALQPFAYGAEGEYHRDDARALLRSIAR